MKKNQAKNRREGGAFIALPANVLNHKNFYLLSPSGCKLFFDLLSQLRFKSGGVVNNGDLCVAWSIMEKRDWRSRETLGNAKKELLHYGWIIQTRQGGRKAPNLYAVTFFAINECGGKLDVSETIKPLGDWKKEVDKWIKPKRKPSGKSDGKLDRVTRLSAPTDTLYVLPPRPPPPKVAKNAVYDTPYVPIKQYQ